MYTYLLSALSYFLVFNCLNYLLTSAVFWLVWLEFVAITKLSMNMNVSKYWKLVGIKLSMIENSLNHSLNCSMNHSIIHSIIRLIIHSTIQSTIQSFTQSFNHLFNHVLNHLFNYLFNNSIIHSFNQISVNVIYYVFFIFARLFGSCLFCVCDHTWLYFTWLICLAWYLFCLKLLIWILCFWKISYYLFLVVLNTYGDITANVTGLRNTKMFVSWSQTCNWKSFSKRYIVIREGLI